MAHNNRRIDEIAAEATEADRLNKISDAKKKAEHEAKLEAEEYAKKIKDFRSEHLQQSINNRTETADEAWASNMGAHILSFDKSATFWDDAAPRLNATRSEETGDKSELEDKLKQDEAANKAASKGDKKEEKKPEGKEGEEKKDEKTPEKKEEKTEEKK